VLRFSAAWRSWRGRAIAGLLPNKALQLTWHSAFQSAFGRVWH
jgi:hypothetical protein